ncbi:hypothetical protein JQX09_15645 [Sulfitobacter pseudonitzschiae]|uniref:Uncharacterized protein n=1 Tax=Pseudosulfitobacter pseudonitzschiae TaxID=1402135 RepID=A0A9Q2RTF3_9RHOB|nr:hypothetical protein [Pseudosulfitobacter pseudonitzschiae]MBM2293463.1 hypothetical protein [Pseudosulfitobacter pseudonitzschiae]MBM2298277.1 hypothetical protein [Pseudosulfitobacter pseudonitzschiae]MBM2303191.1 hypothetical protein [Pseudosulfitobacter pseudonitzschiae]MBM2312974.1 hypothetical protein [Pseudosulfitobacter pseudonitzschiae]MBM2317887.1 hypothetical protein [Pseudosulfitobacter pseudonitzschiae]
MAFDAEKVIMELAELTVEELKAVRERLATLEDQVAHLRRENEADQ